MTDRTEVTLIVDGQKVEVSPGMAEFLKKLGAMHAEQMEEFAKFLAEITQDGWPRR